MACLPIDYICSGGMGDTKESVWKVLKWSFDAMYSGRWPIVDWNNNKWTDSKHHRLRKNKAGQWLTGGSKLRAVVVKLKADLKHFGDTYNIPYKYNTATPCWLCKCTKTRDEKSKPPRDPLPYTDMGTDAAWRSKPRTMEEWREWVHKNGYPHPVFMLQGITCFSCCLDSCHTFDLGYTAHVVGNIFYGLLHYEPYYKNNHALMRQGHHL